MSTQEEGNQRTETLARIYSAAEQIYRTYITEDRPAKMRATAIHALNALHVELGGHDFLSDFEPRHEHVFRSPHDELIEARKGGR